MKDNIEPLRGMKPVDGIHEALDARLAETRNDYVAEWGVRLDDHALVIHFYQIPDQDWSPDMDKRLDRALPKVFDIKRITAGFEKDKNSFYVIAGRYGDVPDTRLLVKRFLDAVDQGC